MILQLINIVSGLLIAAPGLKKWGIQAPLERFEVLLAPYKNSIGVVTLGFGLLGLIDRLGLVNIPIPAFGTSFPQALPAIALGLLLSTTLQSRYPFMMRLVASLIPYAELIGLVGIAAGLGSLLFGCFIPQFCGVQYL